MKTQIMIVLFSCFMSVAFAFPLAAFSQGNTEVHNAIKKLKEKMGDNIKINYHSDGRVKTLDGKLSLPYHGTPEDAVKEFLKENAVIFQMEPTLRDLEVEYNKETLGGYSLRFKQTFNGLPVFNGGVGMYLGKDKSISLVGNSYLSNINISTIPTLSEKEVIEVAKNDYIKNCRYRESKTEEYRSCEGMAIIFRELPYIQIGVLEYQSKPYLVYMVNLATESPTYDSVLYRIDANTGTILDKGSLIVYFSGTGKVFDPNPVNTLSNTGLRDDTGGSPDADAPDFNGAYFTKILMDITFNLNRYFLIGPYVDITDSIERPFYFKKSSGYVLSTSGNFNFTRSPDQFEHVMVYYHIDNNQRYIQSLGFTNVNNRRIKVDPHGLNGADDSYYKVISPNYPPGAGYLAFGEGGVDDAEDADVILHEYGHAIQDNVAAGKYDSGICNPLNSCNNCQFPEAAAMGEGFGDYWAASNTYIANGFDPACFGEWDDVTNPDTDNDPNTDDYPTCLRRVDTTKHYPENIKGECHADGEIWSAALWDMFQNQSLGKTVTDKLILESHFVVAALDHNPTFCDGAKAILQADQQLYAGANKTTIINAMKNRGIGNGRGVIKDLGTLGGNWSEARGINDSGQVVGRAEMPNGNPHAFLWDAVNGMQDLGTLGGNYSEAYGINDSGQVVGVAVRSDGTGHIFLWDAVNGMRDLGFQGVAWDINDLGQVVGGGVNGSHAFLWDAVNGMRDLGTLGGGYSQAYSINNSGQVVGASNRADGTQHAFLWDATNGMQDLGTFGGSHSQAYGINNFGTVAGGADMADGTYHAFLWDAVNGMRDMGTLLGGGASYALGINDSGQISGYSYLADATYHAVLWQSCILQ